MWEVANILKISKSIKLVISKNEKHVFYFTEKNHMDFWANPIMRLRPEKMARARS